MENLPFVQIIVYIYMHLMKDYESMHHFLKDLYELNPRNTQFREKIMCLMEVLILVHLGNE
jgi:hypothetical protein